jgi:hypothetical protein
MLGHETIMQYNETMPVDLQMFDMTSRGYPAHVPPIFFLPDSPHCVFVHLVFRLCDAEQLSDVTATEQPR